MGRMWLRNRSLPPPHCPEFYAWKQTSLLELDDRIRLLIIQKRWFKRRPRTCTATSSNTLRGWMCSSKTAASLVWVGRKNRNIEWNARPSHHYTLQYILKTMRSLYRLWFGLVIIAIPSLSNIHQSAAFYQKVNKNKHTNQTNEEKIFIITRRLTKKLHKQKVKGLETKNGMQLFVKELNKKDRRC